MNRYFGLHTLEGEWHTILPRYLYLAPRIKGRRVLDIGCGTGIGSSLLVEMGAAEVIGVDHRPVVLELAKVKHSKPNLIFRNMLWEELIFENNTFDAVLCLDTASPVTDKNFLTEVQRVLKSDGEYICAISKHTRTGLESLLPRYGYRDTAETLSPHKAIPQTPQPGHLSRLFHAIKTVQQSPCYHFQFHPGPPLSDLSESDHSSSTPDSLPVTHSQPVHLSELNIDNTSQSNVDILICSQKPILDAPAPSYVEMPYFTLVDRIQTIYHEQRERLTRANTQPGWETVMDGQTQPSEVEDRIQTSIYQSISRWDEPPTALRSEHQGSDLDATQDSNALIESDTDDIKKQYERLQKLYHATSQKQDQQLELLQQTLDECNDYIEHLVAKVHRWEEYFRDNMRGEELNSIQPDPHKASGIFDASEESLPDDHISDSSEDTPDSTSTI